uniref:Peptidase C1A papain C-terminal domain-containing protein n=3 Tax=Photinus pyralis TaxID=7054 RepID=A0A1Y1JVG1_PHOPY
MVKLTQSTRRKLENPEVVGDFYEMAHHIPDEFDWRKAGFKTPIYNQKDCGSCYAFSVALALQAQIFKQTNQLVPLSAQQLVDCSVSAGNYGCGGGSLRNTLRYLDQSGGLMTYKDYPYIAKQTRCHFDQHRAIVNLSSWAILPARNERAMEIAIYKIGPIAASINASPHTFQLYHSGVYDDPFCSPNTVNHAMLVVGYTKDAWILKNWWGNRWGEDGYMRLRRGANRCGIANFVAYGVV